MRDEKDKCNRCDHKWWRRTPERPNWCPKCHSPYWDKQRVHPEKKKEESTLTA